MQSFNSPPLLRKWNKCNDNHKKKIVSSISNIMDNNISNMESNINKRRCFAISIKLGKIYLARIWLSSETILKIVLAALRTVTACFEKKKSFKIDYIIESVKKT